MAAVSLPARVERAPGVSGRLLRDDPYRREGLAEYRAAVGRAAREPEALLAMVQAARLRGRGGAGFPTATKLRAVRDAAGSRRHVVANGEEGEPASCKDRYLLRVRPHLVLEGLWAAAAVVAAAQAHVYVSDVQAAASVRDALTELDGEPPVPTAVVEVAASYVAGEESAAVRAIGGGPAKPTVKPPRPFEAGVDGRPTLVQNVETLAHLALIATAGPDAHLAHGTPDSTGTCLLTVSAPGGAATLLETPFGPPLSAALSHGGLPPSADLLVGGFFGGILPAARTSVPLSYDALAAAGTGLGCGALVALGRDECPIAAAAEVMSYFARFNARQCGSCIKGTAAMRDVLRALARGTASADDVGRLRRWASSLRGRGACGVLDGATQLARTLLEHFPDTVASHLRRPCAACAAAGDGSAERFAVQPPHPPEEDLL
jgi:NADH:ubiquinone oxidoreductase subunit F (NADH-binding)